MAWQEKRALNEIIDDAMTKYFYSVFIIFIRATKKSIHCYQGLHAIRNNTNTSSSYSASGNFTFIPAKDCSVKHFMENVSGFIRDIFFLRIFSAQTEKYHRIMRFLFIIHIQFNIITTVIICSLKQTQTLLFFLSDKFIQSLSIETLKPAFLQSLSFILSTNNPIILLALKTLALRACF